MRLVPVESYRGSVGVDRLGEEEQQQEAAGEGEREHHPCRGGTGARRRSRNRRALLGGRPEARSLRALFGHSQTGRTVTSRVHTPPKKYSVGLLYGLNVFLIL